MNIQDPASRIQYPVSRILKPYRNVRILNIIFSIKKGGMVKHTSLIFILYCLSAGKKEKVKS
jgi:hypothetical protein